MFADDVVGDWPGDPEPVRGFAAYKARIAQLLDAVPDLTLEVAEHATNGNLIFIRWIARGTGAEGPFELTAWTASAPKADGSRRTSSATTPSPWRGPPTAARAAKQSDLGVA